MGNPHHHENRHSRSFRRQSIPIWGMGQTTPSAGEVWFERYRVPAGYRALVWDHANDAWAPVSAGASGIVEVPIRSMRVSEYGQLRGSAGPLNGDVHFYRFRDKERGGSGGGGRRQCFAGAVLIQPID